MSETENTEMSDKTGPYTGSVSVIIPTLDGAKELRELLASLTIQSVQPAEILVVDSSSSDDSVSIAESDGAQVSIIDRSAFDHGGTRSRAAQSATSEILVFLTQDVILAHRKVLENLVAPLGEAVGVSYGRQLPNFHATPIAAHLREFNYPGTSVIKTYRDRERLGLGTVFNSNSCAAYRRADLEEIGFFKKGLIFGEDTLVAGTLLKHGKNIAYVAEATVYHSHNYDWGQDFRRYFDIGVFHTEEQWLIDTYGQVGGRGRTYIRSGVDYLYQRRFYSLIGDFMVRVLLKLCGYQLGKRYRRLPRGLARKLSMNKNWWSST